MPSRASLSPCLSFYLSLPLSRFLPPSFSIPLSPPQLCASLSFHFHQLHPLFHPCAFHSLPGGCPSSSSIIHLALIQDTNRVCLVLIPVTHLASFSRERKRGEEEGEREGGRQRDLTVYYPAVCPVLCFSLLPSRQDTTLSPSVYRLDAHPLSQLSLFFSKQPRWCLFIFFLSLSLPVSIFSLSLTFQLSLSCQKHHHVMYFYLPPGFTLSVSRHLLASIFAFTLPFFFPARRLLPPYHVSLLLLFLQCPSDRSTLFSDSHPVLFLDATLRGSWRAPYPHRGTTGGTCVRSTSIDLFQLTYAPARPGLYLLTLPCLRAYGCVHTATTTEAAGGALGG